MFISQSGETADTLAAMAFARRQAQRVLSVVNVQESSMTRHADRRSSPAGPEIGVASTRLSPRSSRCSPASSSRSGQAWQDDRDEERELCRALTEVPSRTNEVLNHDRRIAEIARTIADAATSCTSAAAAVFPIALEGALKLKEITYIHAEGTQPAR